MTPHRWRSVQQSVGLFPRDEMSAFGTAGLIKLLERIMIPSYHKLLRTLRFAVTAALGPNPLEGTELNEQARGRSSRPRKLPPGNFRPEPSARKRFARPRAVVLGLLVVRREW